MQIPLHLFWEDCFIYLLPESVPVVIICCIKILFFSSIPELLILHIPYTDVKINMSFKLYDKKYILRGIVYYGNNHYTSCIISEDNSVWYHDGMQTGNSMILKGDKSYYKSNKLDEYNDKNAVLFVYICTQ
jgi:hypothetical protein